MKSVLLSLIFGFSHFAVATAGAVSTKVTAPSFECVEQTGFHYNFFMGAQPKIEMLDEHGEFLRVMDGLRVEKALEEWTGDEIYSFRYNDSENDNELAYVRFPQSSDKGAGEMIDNDNTMICVRGH